jgi:hypothetical protein
MELRRNGRSYTARGWPDERTARGIVPAMECALVVLIRRFLEGKQRGIFQLSEGKRRGHRGGPVPCCEGDRGHMAQRTKAATLLVLLSCSFCCPKEGEGNAGPVGPTGQRGVLLWGN